MNGVIGMTELLLDTPLDKTQRYYAQTVQTCGKSLLAIISDILDFSKIEAGKLELESIDFNLQKIVDDVFRIMRVRAEEKGVRLVCAVAPQIPQGLVGDPIRLQQILVNLVGNAVKFTEEGLISVVVTQEAEGESEVCLRFVVKDTGIGIPCNKQGLLFDSFTQVDSSNTRVFGGTGLGLAICRQLVGLMAGQIGVNSVEGQGSEFWFKLPFGKQNRAEPRTVPIDILSAHQADGSMEKLELRQTTKEKNLLLVEDNHINQQVVCGILAKLGFNRVDTAVNGVEALALLQAGKKYDLILMDIQMPIMDGISATKRIRETAAWGGADLPIIALTAHALKSDVERCRKAGMSDFITKPVVPEVLLKVLTKWLRSSEVGPISPFTETKNPVALHDDIHSSDDQIFDKRVLQQGLAGNSLLIGQILSSFLHRLPLQIGELRVMSHAERCDEVARLAHALKGSSASIGALRLQRLLQDLERTARKRMPVQQLLAEVEAEGVKLAEMLKGSDMVVVEGKPVCKN